MPEFVIHELAAGGGTLALSPLPGRDGRYAVDLGRLLEWEPVLVLTLTQATELDRKGAAGLGTDLAAKGIAWRHLPTDDYGVMPPDVAALWPEVSSHARAVLARGGRVLVHCYGGCGRSGMIVLRLLVELGEPPENALSRLRRVRPCAVETEAQRLWAISVGQGATERGADVRPG